VMEGNIKNLVQPAEAAPHVGLSTFLDLGWTFMFKLTNSSEGWRKMKNLQN
jgi:hypothetical protein